MVEKKQLYKNISETAKLKADFIHVTEKGEQPEHNEATKIMGKKNQIITNRSMI